MTPDDRTDQAPEEVAADTAERTRASAQSTANDLARMGIDPRALGLDPETAPSPVGTPPPLPAEPPEAPPSDPSEGTGNVVPLRREDGLPPSGTSAAWAAAPPAITGDESAPAAYVDPLSPLLGHEPSAPGAPSALPDLARSVMFGMVTPDAAETAEREREMVGRVRARQSEHRVVVFLSGKGGVGTTTVATGVATVLAVLRDDVTSLVSLRAGAPSLGRLMTGAPAPSAREIARTDVEIAPLRTPAGLQIVDGPRWSTPVRRNDVPAILDALGQDSAFTLVDVGNDASDAAQSVLARADQVVIVSGPGDDNVDGARVAAERVADLDPYALDTAVYVVVCPRESAARTVVRRMRDALPGGARVVVIPPEPWLAEGAAFDPARVGIGTRLALLDVAGLVAMGSLRPGGER
jgi:MinD-like ATPase involved in chromosome partitioning or flagellar assembly